MEKSNIVRTVLIFCLLAACTPAQRHEREQDYARIIGALNLQTISSYEMKRIYSKANDSLVSWELHGLKLYLNILKKESWRLDSLFVFNAKGDKLASVILSQTPKSLKSNSDALIDFYGVKIDSNWYFFAGATHIVPRDLYIDTLKHNIFTPLSFEQLHELAIKRIYKGYLKTSFPNDTTNLSINQKWFDEIAGKHDGGYGSCWGCKSENEYYLTIVRDNWKKRDSSSKNTSPSNQ